jgi:hypothetical protein
MSLIVGSEVIVEGAFSSSEEQALEFFTKEVMKEVEKCVGALISRGRNAFYR